jgi:hypothetical protein
MEQKSKPIAVLISDIHFTLQTLDTASLALKKAQLKAHDLEVPLVICGDTLDSKAIIRAEIANRLIELLSVKDAPDTIVLVGNHDLCNERGKTHSLNFVKPYCTVIETMYYGRLAGLNVLMVPYQSDVTALRQELLDVECYKDIVIMHQGLQGSDSGEYYQDPTALNPEDVAHLRVISGHYHRRQTIDTGKGNKFDYIGNPYTLGFGEANHPEKGFQILMSDGSLEFVPTGLRKHIVIHIKVGDLDHPDLWQYDYQPGDLLWVKVSGQQAYLSDLTKAKVADYMQLKEDFRLEVIPEETNTTFEMSNRTQTMKQEEVLDNLIASLTNTDQTRKERLQTMWKKLVQED